jgi:hypothetical protein
MPDTTTTRQLSPLLAALEHREPPALPVDFGSTFVTGIHVSCVAALRRHYGLGSEPVRVIDPGQMLGEIGEDLASILGISTAGVRSRMARYGFPLENWKTWRMDDGLEVLVPGAFTVTRAPDGSALMHPRGEISLPPSAVMPPGGYFFNNLIRQAPIDEARLDPRDNLEEYRAISDGDLDHFTAASQSAAATGRIVVASFGGTSFGDIAHIPGVSLPFPKGIRDVAEWYMSLRSRRDYVHQVFSAQCDMALDNLERIAARVAPLVDVINICGTDFGTQASSFCSVPTFRELWFPYYKRVNDWVHRHTNWKTFKHSCGAVSKFLPAFIECGFDILNPVQCSAAGMDPETLKQTFGRDLVFWGGGVDTQHVLPFGTPAEVREQALRRCEILAPQGGFVFNAVHNVQAGTPVQNLVAMIDALHEFQGKRYGAAAARTA